MGSLEGLHQDGFDKIPFDGSDLLSHQDSGQYNVARQYNCLNPKP